jgi:hypothetical protein
MNIALRYRDRIDTSKLMPQVNWREARNARPQPASAGAHPSTSGPELAVAGATVERDR